MNLKREIEIELHLRKAVDLGLVTKRINKQKFGHNIITIYEFSFVHLHFINS